jgi:hypothetical protein
MQIIELAHGRICSANAVLLTSLFPAKRTAKNSDEAAGASLLFSVLQAPTLRISAKNRYSLAVDFRL